MVITICNNVSLFKKKKADINRRLVFWICDLTQAKMFHSDLSKPLILILLTFAKKSNIYIVIHLTMQY